MTSPCGDPGMVIIGAGECGTRAAFALREQDYHGAVTLIGEEVHLPYERPPLSKDAMAEEAEPAVKAIADPQRLADSHILLLSSARAVSIDRTERSIRLDNGASVPYAKLLLATGASPRRISAAPSSSRCITLRTFDDALEIRRHLAVGARVAIVGGGFIGLELAASARLRGCPVTVIEAQPRILMRGVPAELAALIHAEHDRHGVCLLCGRSIASIAEVGSEIAITLSEGEVVVADLCIIGIGAVPNVELAREAGLANDNGIAVDAELRTSDPDIFAAGDCCSFPLNLYGGRRVRLEAWRNAQDQGTLAARNMLGQQATHITVPWFWSDQYDLGLQIAGLVDEGAETVRRDVGPDAVILFHLAADGRLVAASGLGPGTAVARDIRIAEILIARRAAPTRDVLAAPETKLKALLAA